MTISAPPPPFTLRQLQYAVAIADTLSFRRAAARCHVSQPSLSAQVAQLEDALGVRLFERDRRRVLVTEVGKAILERARGVLLGVDDLVRTAARAADPFVGTLRLGVIPTISPYLLPAITPALRAAYPALSLRWIEDKTAVLARDLGAGLLDAAVLALEADLGHVERAILAVDPFVLATPAGHPLGTRRGPASLAELSGHEVLLLNEGHCFREQALALCSQAGVRELEFRATSLSTLATMVAAGAGITLLPALALGAEGARSKLSVRSLKSPAPHRTIALVWRKGSPSSEPLRKLAAAMRRAYPTPGTPTPRRPR